MWLWYWDRNYCPDEMFGQVLKVVTADENGIVCIEDMKQFVIMVEM